MGGLFKTPKPPKVEEPTPMPDVQEDVVQDAGRKAVARQQKKSGFTSTVLSRASTKETLGA